MLFLVQNKILTQNKERTYLTAEVASGATTLTVRSIDADEWSDNDWIILGEIGTENAELLQVNGTPTDGTSLTIDNAGSGGTRYAHSADEPVYRIDYNQVKFFRATTETGTKTTLTTIDIQPSDFQTAYDDITNETGFGFAAFFNSTNSNQSPYSDAIPYGTQSDKSLSKLIGKVRDHLDEKDDDYVTDEEITDALNTRQRMIVNDRMWVFNETERSQSTVADQLDYDIDSDIKTIHSCRVNSQPAKYIGRAQWERYNYDTDATAETPSALSIFVNKMRFWPRPSTAATTTTLNGAVAAGDTTITVDSITSFKRADYYRFKINDEVIYADAVDTTNLQFTGCSRGQEGTTAAAHSDADTVTEQNIVYTGQLYATNLLNLNDETIIPEPDVLTFGAAADIAAGKLSNEKKAQYWELKAQAAFDDLRDKFSIKFTSQMGRVKTAEESGIWNLPNPNDNPTDVTAS